jgi:ubiquinone/menaquinone biosynthesis C-methylase UbiE
MSSKIVFTNRIAENYEKYMGPIFFEPCAKDTVSRLDPGKINSILEIACGTGQVTRLLKKRLPGARIVATDLNPGMLELAKKIVDPKDNIEFLPANAEVLPFGDNTFDAVVCQFGLMFVPDKQKAVNEAYRVLRTGGKFIFAAWDRLEKNPAHKIAQDTIASFFKDNPPDFYNLPFSMYDPAEFDALLSSTGFRNIEIENVQMASGPASAEDNARALTEGTPAYLAITERDPALFPEIQKALTHEIEDVYGSAQIVSPMASWVCEGIK